MTEDTITKLGTRDLHWKANEVALYPLSEGLRPLI